MNHKDTKYTKDTKALNGEKLLANNRSNDVIGAAIEVHRNLGPGLLESVYEEAMCVELGGRSIPFRRQVSVPVTYKGVLLGHTLRIDLLVDDMLVVELKAASELLPVHSAQLLTYLKLTDRWLGLILNFNTVSMRQGIRRVVYK